MEHFICFTSSILKLPVIRKFLLILLSYHITEKKTITVLQDVFVKNVPLSAYRKSVMMIRQFYRLSLRTAGRQVDRDIL